MFSGPQVQPWICTTKVTNPNATNPDLGDPLDAQCNIAAAGLSLPVPQRCATPFATYDPANPPPRQPDRQRHDR